MLTKHDERKMPKNLGHIASLARSYTNTAIKTLAGIMMEPNCLPMARVAAAKVLHKNMRLIAYLESGSRHAVGATNRDSFW
jgi:hypothetical protein